MVRADAFSEGRLRLTGAGRARHTVLRFIIDVIVLKGSFSVIFEMKIVCVLVIVILIVSLLK